MVVDIGTGDGRFVLAAAAASPECLVIGLDADARAMIDASRRAAGPARRGGLPNALFVAAAAEWMPTELEGRADLVTVHFPWGSLLGGLIGSDSQILGGLARIAHHGAEIRTLLSVTERDVAGAGGRFDPDAIRSPTTAGLRLCEVRRATAEEIAASDSTWAKRLRAATDRPVWLIRWERA